MTAPSAHSTVDDNVTAALEILRVYRRLSHKELIVASGIGKSKMIRRRADGGWTADEVQRLADALKVPVAAFYNGPDALLGGIPHAEGGPVITSSFSTPFCGAPARAA